MRETLRRKRQEEGGFTLIELLLVIVILGILAAVVVLSVRGITDRGQTSACGASRTALITASEAAYARNGSYPATSAALQATNLFTVGNGASVTGAGIAGNGWTVTYAAGVVGPCVITP